MSVNCLQKCRWIVSKSVGELSQKPCRWVVLSVSCLVPAFSRYTIITHLCSRASPAVYTKSDDMTHLFLETTCSLLSLRVIMWKLINVSISSWSNHVPSVIFGMFFLYPKFWNSTLANNIFFNYPKILTVGLLCLLTSRLPNHVNILWLLALLKNI